MSIDNLIEIIYFLLGNNKCTEIGRKCNRKHCVYLWRILKYQNQNGQKLSDKNRRPCAYLKTFPDVNAMLS